MKKEVSNWSSILEIIAAGLTRNTEKVANYAALLATHLDAVDDPGNRRIAARIRSLLGTSLIAGQPTMVSPVDAESRSPFVDEAGGSAETRPILPPAAANELERFVRLYQQQDRLLREGLPTPRSLLLYGPPGCGKTTAARYVAHALRLPLLTVRLDAVMSSYLGTTAKNLRLVFEHAARRGGILFLDEFDALAKLRDDSNEVGEIKRIVNSLIQNLDAFPRMPVIAATNHEHLLDPAIWRRFDTVVRLPLPGRQEREALLLHFLVVRATPTAFAETPKPAAGPDTALRRSLRAASAGPREAGNASPSRLRGIMTTESGDALSPIAPFASIPVTTASVPARGDTSMVDDEELALLAELTEGCSGADLEQIVMRVRQERVLADVAGDADERNQRPMAELLTWQIWQREREGMETRADGSEDRAALVRFIDERTHMRVSARAISALTGIPGSTVARIRQLSSH